MNQEIPQVNGMVQVIMAPPTEAEINAAAAVPMVNDRSDSVGVVITAAGAMANNNIIRLSKNMKLRMAHRGFKEIAQTWADQDTFGVVVSGSSSTLAFIAAETKPSNVIAKTDDGLVITNPGTFTKTSGYEDVANIIPYTNFKYDGNYSSSSANDGLVGPDLPALTLDQSQLRATIKDMPGRENGIPITPENYLSLPGLDIATSETYVAVLAAEAQ